VCPLCTIYVYICTYAYMCIYMCIYMCSGTSRALGIEINAFGPNASKYPLLLYDYELILFIGQVLASGDRALHGGGGQRMHICYNVIYIHILSTLYSYAYICMCVLCCAVV
jgi:hypothetical protein